MKSVCRWVLCAVPLLVSHPVEAQTEAPNEAPTEARSARELLTGLDVFIRPTHGSFLYNDQNAFFRLGLTSSSRLGRVPGPDDRTATLFEGGAAVDGGVIYRCR